MGDVIRFPLERRSARSESGGPPIPMDECSELVHVFDEVPGTCKCGQNEWDALPVHEEGVTFDTTRFEPPPAS